MSGYAKEEPQVKVEDSNMAGVGGDEDKAVRKGAAQGEAAWGGCGKKAGVEVWRIEKFQVVRWPEKDNGSFYKGDSYICLKTTEDPESKALHWDIHFWLGSNTSIDEQGTAAYKTVELDALFDDAAIQHRECEGYESKEFKAMFKHLRYLEGGVDSGFKHVGAAIEGVHLFHVRKTGPHITVNEVAMSKDSMNTGDCFVLDSGDVIYTYFGSEASAFEKNAAGTYAENVEATRNGAAKTVDYNDGGADFWALLGGEGPIADSSKGADDKNESVLGGSTESIGEGVLYKLSDDSGKLRFAEASRGNLKESMLEHGNVYIVDCMTELFVWVGNKASKDEVMEAMISAVTHIEDTKRPRQTPISMFKDGSKITNKTWIKMMKD